METLTFDFVLEQLSCTFFETFYHKIISFLFEIQHPYQVKLSTHAYQKILTLFPKF